jgi:hypothetical protein
LTALLDDEYREGTPARICLGLVGGGLRQRGRQSGLIGDAVPAVDGLRAGALVVLTAWTAFVIAGASFAKFSEHFDEALPHAIAAHRVPDLAFSVLQATAAVASVLVVAGALLAVPAFARFLQAGGWVSVRRHFSRALTCTGLAVAVTVALLMSSHHLMANERNIGFHWYGVLFLVWAAIIVVAVTQWASVAVATARRVEFSTIVLGAEAMLAAAVAVAMVVMVAAVSFWWGAMAKDAPSFLRASPGGAPGSPLDLWLIATVVLMAIAMGTASIGVAREVRVWTTMRSE